MKIDISSANLIRFETAWVGNKSRYEGVNIPDGTLSLNDVAHELVTTTFLKPFEKTGQAFHCGFHSNGGPSEAYLAFQKIFSDNGNAFAEISFLARRLYDYSEYPKIRGGEFMLAVFDDLIYDGQPVSGIALVKVQSKDTFIKIERAGNNFATTANEGVSTTKLEVAALVLNIDEAEGFVVFAIDTVTKKGERSFWIDEFLRLRPIEDNYFNTRHYINVTKEFITEKIPHKFGVDRVDQNDMKYRAGLYFKENDTFEIEDFATTLFSDSEVATAFIAYRNEYSKAYAAPLENRFDIDPAAVKKEVGSLAAKIKLDKNFDINVHGRRDLIELGFDEERGKKYYKFYFDDEN